MLFPLIGAFSALYPKGSGRALEVVQSCFCVCYEFGRGVNVPTAFETVLPRGKKLGIIGIKKHLQVGEFNLERGQLIDP